MPEGNEYDGLVGFAFRVDGPELQGILPALEEALDWYWTHPRKSFRTKEVNENSANFLPDDDETIRDSLTALLLVRSQLPDHLLNAWDSLSKQIDLGLRATQNHPAQSWTINPEQLRMLGEQGIELEISVYLDPEFWRTSPGPDPEAESERG